MLSDRSWDCVLAAALFLRKVSEGDKAGQSNTLGDKSYVQHFSWK
jgi:hypothetical protein